MINGKSYCEQSSSWTTFHREQFVITEAILDSTFDCTWQDNPGEYIPSTRNDDEYGIQFSKLYSAMKLCQETRGCEGVTRVTMTNMESAYTIRGNDEKSFVSPTLVV